GSSLTKLQGETPFVLPFVDRQAVAEVVSGWTGIPLGKMVLDEIKTVLTLREKLEERVIGQSHALEAIAQRIRTSRAGLTDPRRPIAVFMMVGPSGVGKTETAMALGDILILTSNVGTDTIMKMCADPDTRPDPAKLGEVLRADLLKAFKPALLGRISVVPYYPLSDEVMRSIIKLQLKRIADRLRENHKAAFSYAD